MMEFSDSLLDSRDLRLIPTVWWQTLLNADPQRPPHEGGVSSSKPKQIGLRV